MSQPYDGAVKIAYIASAGSNDPTRASIPFHLAVNGSVEVGHETSVVLAGDAAALARQDVADGVEGIGVPPLRDLLNKVRERDVTVFV